MSTEILAIYFISMCYTMLYKIKSNEKEYNDFMKVLSSAYNDSIESAN